MKNGKSVVFTLIFHGDGLQPDGLYEVKDIDMLFKMLSTSKREKVTINRHEISHHCEVCSGDSIVDSMTIYLRR